MSFKQSAFNFDFVPEENKPETKAFLKEKESSPELTEQEAIAEKEAIVLEDEVVFKPADKKPVEIKDPSNDNTVKKSSRGRMKLSDMNASAALIEVPEDAVLFEKSYYSIGTVSEMFKVNQSLIRFWENEFIILKPKKNAKGDRFFRPEDVKNLKLIYHLLRERKYTIEGAKAFLKNNKNAEKKFQAIESLKDLKSFLNELKANL